MSSVIDPDRAELLRRGEIRATGVYVRAEGADGWRAADAAELDAESLLDWLRSRGGRNKWAEDFVGIVLGHGHLHVTEEAAK